MRVLLVQAFTALDMEKVYPLGLASLAAHLDGHEVRIFDVNLHRDRPYDALEEAVRAFSPEVVGFSLRNMKVGMPHRHTDDFEPQRLAVERVRRVAPGVPILAGGTAFSLYSEAMMRRLPEIDVGVWGEAEHRLPALLERLDRPGQVPGVWYRDGAALRFSGAPPVVDFQALRPPRRDLLPLEPYLESSFVSVGVQSKRGCALKCLHCSDTYLAGNRVRLRPPERVADEVEALVRDHGVREFFFCDQAFNIPATHAAEVCRALLARQLPVRWSAWFNEHPDALPEDLLPLLKAAGCTLLSFSPDHVDDRVLQRLDKNFSAADLERTVRLAADHGFDVEYSFFLNAPGEDLRSLARLLAFIARARLRLGPRLRLFSLLLLQPIRIYPHTRIHELAVAAGLVHPDDDLIQGRYWNPAPLSGAVKGIQVGARALYGARQAVRRVRGVSYDALGR